VNIDLLLVPYDSGHRGWRMGAGPAALLSAGLPAALERAGHRARTRTVEAEGERRGEAGTAFELMAALSSAVRESRRAGSFPLVLAGNCNTAVGTVAGLGLGDDVAVLWFDAHGDFNTPETTLGGFLDGMALAILTGRCWTGMARGVPGFHPAPEANTCLLGARDLDPLEREALAASRVEVLRPSALPSELEGVIRRLARPARRAYLHVDLDVLDPREGRVNQFAAPDGLSVPDLLESVARIGAGVPVRAAALTAYDPALDPDGRIAAAAIGVALALAGTAGSRASG
jgi:arginase